jgi:RNA polymerase primary sigma factor
MGSVSLLTREGEVEIAKRIEDGENKVLNTILQSPIAVQEIIKLGEKVKHNKVRLKDVVRDADDEEGYNEDDVRKRVDRLTEKVKRLQLHIESLEESLDPEQEAHGRRKTARSSTRSRRPARRCARRSSTCASTRSRSRTSSCS